MAVKRLCRVAGCNGLAEYPERYCSKHLYLKRRDEERANTFLGGKQFTTGYSELYNTPKWKSLSRKQLKEHPFCTICGNKATEVDHIVAHKGNLDLFYNEDNLQSLCHECHSKKTLEEIHERNQIKYDEYNRVKRNKIITDNYKVQW